MTSLLVVLIKCAAGAAAAGALYCLLARTLDRIVLTRRERRRPAVIRGLCAILGIGILAAVGFRTIGTASAIYTQIEKEAGLRIRVPSRPPPPLPATEAGVGQVRFLFVLLFVDGSYGRLRPVFADSFEIRWPEDRGRPFSRALDLDGATAQVQLRINAVEIREPGGGGARTLSCNRTLSLDRKGPNWKHGSGSSGWMEVGRPLGLGGRGTMGLDGSAKALSLARPLLTADEAIAYLLPVAAGDPLTEISLGELVSGRHDEIATESAGDLPNERDALDAFLKRTREPPLAPSLDWAVHIGRNTLLVLLAVILLVQCLRQRILAWPTVLAGVVLYAILLDRMALGVHLYRLGAPEAPLAQRRIACLHSADTFFFRRTARETTAAVSRDSAVPEELRRLAGTVAEALRDAAGAEE